LCGQAVFKPRMGDEVAKPNLLGGGGIPDFDFTLQL
jgi:hypothetical protein